jgi:predicted Zn-dependent protease
VSAGLLAKFERDVQAALAREHPQLSSEERAHRRRPAPRRRLARARGREPMSPPPARALTAVQAAREARRLVDDVWRGVARWETGYRRAHALLRAAVGREPRNTLLLTCLGTILSDLGRHREAVNVLKRAVARGANDRHTVFNLAVATLNAGRHESAMTLFRRAGRLRPRRNTWEAYFDPQGH